MDGKRLGIGKFVAGRDSEKAFTLLEAMIALAILSFGILGVVAMFTTSIGGNSQGRSMTEAATLAQSQLDYLATGKDYNGLNSGSSAGLNPDGTAGGRYNVTWTVTSSFSPLKMKRVNVAVTWTVKGENHKVEYDTLRAKE